MHSVIALALPLLASVPAALAWGDVGHQTVGFIAQNFVTSDTASWIQSILNDDSSTYMGSAATWADSYRYTSEGSFSYPYHFIDANDNPPSSCSVDFDRDCGDTGCSVSAISNYTARVQDTSLSATQQTDAMKFLIHFFGDITQPLHDENLEVGGNDIDVTFNGESTNLHHIWDTNMIEMYVGGSSIDDAQAWANNLTTEIQSGQYQNDASSWIANMNINDAQSTAMNFAQDANAFVCSEVLAQGENYVENNDLAGQYYQTAIPIFSEQIAKGGYRLANWLNTLSQQSGSQKRSVSVHSPRSYDFDETAFVANSECHAEL